MIDQSILRDSKYAQCVLAVQTAIQEFISKAAGSVGDGGRFDVPPKVRGEYLFMTFIGRDNRSVAYSAIKNGIDPIQAAAAYLVACCCDRLQEGAEVDPNDDIYESLLRLVGPYFESFKRKIDPPQLLEDIVEYMREQEPDWGLKD